MPDAALLDPPTAAPPPAAATGPLANLILARLLVAPKGVGVAALARAAGEAYRSPPSREQVARAVAGLKAAALLAAGKGQILSAAGRNRALTHLGVAELPAKANWGTVQRLLAEKAIGGPVTAVALVRRKYALPASAGDGPAAVMEALACKLLGFADQVSLKAVAAAAISREADLSVPLASDTLTTLGPENVLGLKPSGRGRAAALRRLALTGLADPVATRNESAAATAANVSVSPAVEPEPLDLEAFAETVLAVARHCPTGRFGDTKVFIAHVWRQAQAEPQFPRLTLPEFKARLVEANRARLLTLSPADLVQFMNSADVRESATEYLGSEFHFVLAERGAR